MAYTIKKSSRIVEELELLDDNDNVVKIIKIDISADRIASGYRKAEVNLLTAQRNAKKNESSVTLEAYGKAVIELFKIVFGIQNTAELLEYFDGEYTDMLICTMPFINEKIKPAIEKTVYDQKQRIAQNCNFSKKQKNKLGLK